MAGIPEDTINQILDRVDIVEVVGGYIPLKRAGRNYRALCPFHHEKTPSFMVSQDKQIFHCFGCGAGGNVFNFVMKYERLEFPEAARMLAQESGVVIPSTDSRDPQAESFTNKLYAANELATDFYHKNLLGSPSGKEAGAYLKDRGLTEESIKLFKLGYSLPRWDGVVSLARSKGIEPDILQKAGLAIKRNTGDGYFDRFRDRIIFPIFNIKNRIIGFGGRVFKGVSKDDPKYMNSPETQIYNKSRNLYGLNFTWREISKEDLAIIVEGYLDLIIPYQAGVRNMVASLGTALTREQIGLIRRYTKNTVIIFDSDRAGEFATLRSLDLLLEEGLSVSIVRLEAGSDPDSFVRKHGPDRFKELISSACNLFDYKMGLLKSRYDSRKTEDKARIVEEMLPTIAKVKNAVLRSEYIKSLAHALLLDEDAIRLELKKVKPDYAEPRQQKAASGGGRPSGQIPEARQSEKMLAAIMLSDNIFVQEVKENLDAEDFQDPVIRKIVDILFKFSRDSKAISPSRLINYLDDESERRYIPELVDFSECVVDREKTLRDCIVKLEQDNLKDKLNKLQVEIALAQNSADEDRITQLIARCNKLIKGIKECNEKTKAAI
ncbi:MAG: DNA primase [Candidatus Omnitrophota bacterium]